LNLTTPTWGTICQSEG